MEEILASIRRIISEGDESPSANEGEAKTEAEAQEPQPDEPQPDEPQPDEPEETSEEVLELTEVVGDEEGEEQQPELADFEVDLVEDEMAESGPEERFEPEPSDPDQPPAAAADAGGAGRDLATTDDEDDPLVSDDTAVASSDAFAELAQSVAAAEIRQDQSPRISHSHDRTLEDVVREAIRPLLKDWLDKNLPSLVHHLVKKEIERLSRR